MDRSPILFRCEGSAEHGWEPFYQCLTYAAALQRRRRGTYFLGRFEPFQLLSQIARGGSEFLTSPHVLGSPEDCDDTIRQVRRLGAAAVVVSAPGITTEYLRELSSTGALVLAIDSEAAVRFPTKLVLNPLLGPELKSYSWERGTQMLLGKRYAIVRPVFRRQRQVRVVEPQAPYRAIIAFGDDDFAGQSLLRAQELLAASRVDKVTVAIRCHHPQADELKDLAKEHTGRLEVLTETSELSTRLPRAHFALTSGDGWSLEMACVGVPQFVLPQCNRHLANAQELDDAGAATFLGRAYEVSNATLRDAIHNLLDDPLERLGMSRCGRQLIDGRGPDRMVNALEIMLHPAQIASEMRRAA